MAPPQDPQPLSSQIETLSFVSGLVEAFKAFDSDSDGLITAEELGGIVASLGYNVTGDVDLNEMMRLADSDGDGLLTFTEVVEMMGGTDGRSEDLAGMLGAALLELADEGGGGGAGTVSGEELYEVLSCMGRLSVENCRDVIASLDGDGDGTLNLEDLKLVVQALL